MAFLSVRPSSRSAVRFASAALDPDLMLRRVIERLAAQDDALPIGRPSAGRAAGHLGELADAGEIADDTLGVRHQGDELHARVARLARQDIHVEGPLQELRPGTIGARTLRAGAGRAAP